MSIRESACPARHDGISLGFHDAGETSSEEAFAYPFEFHSDAADSGLCSKVPAQYVRQDRSYRCRLVLAGMHRYQLASSLLGVSSDDTGLLERNYRRQGR